MRIEIISGSPRQGSVTKRVALHLQQVLSRELGVVSGLIDMQQHAFAYVDQVWMRSEDVPPQHTSIAQRIFNADGFILVSPEYNGSYSPALKTFLDQFPKQERKVFGIVTASPGKLGGIRAAIQLQHLVFGISGIGSPQMLIVPEVDKKFTAEGELADHSFATSIQSFADEYLWLTRALNTATGRKQVAAA